VDVSGREEFAWGDRRISLCSEKGGSSRTVKRKRGKVSKLPYKGSSLSCIIGKGGSGRIWGGGEEIY